ncbi:MAG TPA: phosphatase PAP2/dual specificity phosphatase family protein [Verrucomicrobiae bacterium]|nr:phosphatase PAP2/dual specificity phosphatase family protein [Verrucomicrobiae bacterium]
MKLWKPAIASAVLSALFVLTYGGINWLTAQRSDVGMLFFEWERAIPFVPWLIVPYMSIDLFFVVAPFVCKSEEELKVFARRVVFVVLVAGAVFLLFPLKFAFVRPAVSGAFGFLFNALTSFDQPFNLLPSQHITLRTILAATYVRNARGVGKFIAHVWFSLIGISTVLVYQHHVLDVVGGFVVAGMALYLFSESPRRLAFVPNYRIGFYYLGGFAAVAAILLSSATWAAILLWPAMSLLIVAAGYFKFGPTIYRKRDGRIPLAARLVLGPVLIGQYLSLLFYKRQCRAYDEVSANVWIGRRLNDREAAAVRNGVTAVLDLTAEFSEAKAFRGVKYLNVPILDLTAPPPEQLGVMAEFIKQESRNGVVYVHCKAGYSRSAAAVAAYLIESGACGSGADAFQIVKAARPSVVIRPEIWRAFEGGRGLVF